MKLRFVIFAFFATFVLMSADCQSDSDEVTDKRDELKGDWTCTVDGTPPDTYVVTISKEENDDKTIYLANFVNNGGKATGTIAGFNITVAEQQVGNVTVSGTGTIKDDYQSITWTLKIDGDDFTATYSPGGITKNALTR